VIYLSIYQSIVIYLSIVIYRDLSIYLSIYRDLSLLTDSMRVTVGLDNAGKTTLMYDAVISRPAAPVEHPNLACSLAISTQTQAQVRTGETLHAHATCTDGRDRAWSSSISNVGSRRFVIGCDRAIVALIRGRAREPFD